MENENREKPKLRPPTDDNITQEKESKIKKAKQYLRKVYKKSKNIFDWSKRNIPSYFKGFYKGSKKIVDWSKRNLTVGIIIKGGFGLMIFLSILLALLGFV